MEKKEYLKLSIKRTIAENIFSMPLQYINLSLFISMPLYSLINFPLGIALGFLLLRGIGLLPGFLLGSVIALQFYYSNYVELSLVIFAKLTMLYYLYFKLIQCNLIFYNFKNLFKFLLSSLIWLFTFNVLLVGFSLNTLFQSISDFNGIALLTIGIITWDAYFPDIHNISKTKIILLLAYTFLALFSFYWIYKSYYIIYNLILMLIFVLVLIKPPIQAWPFQICSLLLFAVGFEILYPLYSLNMHALIMSLILSIIVVICLTKATHSNKQLLKLIS